MHLQRSATSVARPQTASKRAYCDWDVSWAKIAEAALVVDEQLATEN